MWNGIFSALPSQESEVVKYIFDGYFFIFPFWGLSFAFQFHEMIVSLQEIEVTKAKQLRLPRSR
jgi:hypothetical protein